MGTFLGAKVYSYMEPLGYVFPLSLGSFVIALVVTRQTMDTGNLYRIPGSRTREKPGLLKMTLYNPL